MKTTTTTDPKWERPESYGPLDTFFLGLLKDERDLVFVHTALFVSGFVFPAALVLFLSPPWLVALLAGPYVAGLFVLFGNRYGLMLHATGHRPIFRREVDWLGRYIPWVLGPFMGHTPGSFMAHHMHMHHAENNMFGDQSCTLPYVRDRFDHFLHYWARFFFVGYVHLVRYLLLRDKRKTARAFVLGELSWVALVAVAMAVNPAAAVVVFIVPFLMMRVFLMCGNWAQHAFVDLSDPDNAFNNSNCLINTRFNHVAFNDGYHIVHHLFPGMHWTEMAAWYEDHVDQFAENDCVVLEGVGDNIVLWLKLMTHQYDDLARRMVDFKGRSHEEKVAFLQDRVRKTQGERLPILYLETADDVVQTARATA